MFISAFRDLGGILNHETLATVMLSKTAGGEGMLKNLMREYIDPGLTSGHNVISSQEVLSVARVIFGKSNAQALACLGRDRCLGYTEEEVAQIRHKLENSSVFDSALCEMLGCYQPKRRY